MTNFLPCIHSETACAGRCSKQTRQRRCEGSRDASGFITRRSNTSAIQGETPKAVGIPTSSPEPLACLRAGLPVEKASHSVLTAARRSLKRCKRRPSSLSNCSGLRQNSTKTARTEKTGRRHSRAPLRRLLRLGHDHALRQRFSEAESSADDQVRLPLVELVRPLRNTAASEAEGPGKLSAAAENCDGSLLRNRHSRGFMVSTLDTVYVKHAKQASV